MRLNEYLSELRNSGTDFAYIDGFEDGYDFANDMLSNSEIMKTFVAEGVLCDYTCGMVVVKATNKEEAINLIKNDVASYDVGDVLSTLRELKEGEVVMVYGGG